MTAYFVLSPDGHYTPGVWKSRSDIPANCNTCFNKTFEVTSSLVTTRIVTDEHYKELRTDSGLTVDIP